MKKQRIDYDSPIDALIAVTKRLSVAEDHHRMTSEEFYDKFTKGQSEDSIGSITYFLRIVYYKTKFT